MGKRMKEDGEDEGGWGRGRWRMGKRMKEDGEE